MALYLIALSVNQSIKAKRTAQPFVVELPASSHDGFLGSL